MFKSLQTGRLLPHLLLFIVFNLTLYLFINQFHSLFPFYLDAYLADSHHYLPDPRSENQPFDLFSALAQYDSQWYLKIADSGYTYNPLTPADVTDKSTMNNLVFAFFPLFPLLIKLTHFVVSDLHISAFITSNLLLILNFISLYLVISKFSNRSVAVKTAWLVFVFPFSIFYRSYFTENLQLLLSLWFFYFFISGRYLPASVFLSFLGLTKGIVLPVGLIFAAVLTQKLFTRRLSLPAFLAYGAISSLGLLSWIFYNYLATGDPVFFHSVLSVWFPKFPYPPAIYNFFTILALPQLPIHSIHFSRLDSIICVLSFITLYRSFKRLPRLLWLYSLILWAIPFFTRDLASFSRYQSASFPLFFALAKSSGKAYYLLLSIFTVLLFITSLYFSNWYWVG